MDNDAKNETDDKQPAPGTDNFTQPVGVIAETSIAIVPVEIRNMEVHHHPDLTHEPKKWKEYLLEFVMIFLAVTLGFIAENVREYIANSEKERQYVSAFIHNLKDDTSYLRQVIIFDKMQVKGMDSMLTLSHVNMDIDINRKSFYNNAIHYLYSSSSFRSNDATLQQLKSTGDFRLLEKNHVADSLTKYDTEVRNIYTQGSYYETYFKEILSRLDELGDMTIIRDSTYLKNGNMTDKQPPPLRIENGKLVTFFNKVFDFRVITNSYVNNYLIPELENSTNLIVFLQKTYHIAEE